MRTVTVRLKPDTTYEQLTKTDSTGVQEVRRSSSLAVKNSPVPDLLVF
jgi:hypothetical protein